ncbi:PREDICTED: hepcidin [Condylura cristata]|uniref:hepcidin n=1 Tax=Condylura cristata TaxID=143302 RepID=UPI00033475B8|nr:PREDICTED: hepcidin [Condylura cristata]
MAQNVRTQATCLLLLLLASMASGVVLQRQTRQPAHPQAQDTVGAEDGLTLGPRRLSRRDTHFPICMFCCNCCPNMKHCGICCKA